MATRKPLPKQDPLDALLQDPNKVMALMLWQARLRQPDMYVQLTETDITGLEDCCRYLKVKPQVKISRPGGLEAQAAIPATAKRRAVPAREATPPKPYVMVCLVDEKGDVIRPVENNQEDFDAAAAAAEVRKARDQAPQLAQLILQQAKSGEYSLSDIQDAANALLTLARAA